MNSGSHDDVWPRGFGFVLPLVATLVAAGAISWMMIALRRGETIETTNQIYLMSGSAAAQDVALAAFEWSAGGALRLVPRAAAVGGALLEPGASRVVTVGRYYYRVDHRVWTKDDARQRHELKWALVGARLDVGDEVGRNPSVLSTGRLAYDVKDRQSGGAAGVTRKVPLWLDALPIRAFVIRPPATCTGTWEVCIEFLGGEGRVTIERAEPVRAFEHPRRGDVRGLGAHDRLWIGHLSFSLLPAPQSNGGTDLRLLDDFERYAGDRRGLGDFGFHGATGELAPDVSIPISDVTSQFRTGHLSDQRWEPETEDEYQLLIDEGLLCLELTPDDGRIVPQLVWRDVTHVGCVDPLGDLHVARDPAIRDMALEIYRRRRQGDQLVRRTNDYFRGAVDVRPDDLPFVFEWSVANDANALVKIPVTLWGSRTNATRRELAPFVSHDAGTFTPASRPIVLHARDGATTVLVHTVGATRMYAAGEQQLGLGPLIGIRDAVDGLDSVTPDIDMRKVPTEIALTIDPDLQLTMWRTLRARMAGVSHDGGTRSTYGVSVVALDPSQGNLLAVLNWPSATQWESADSFEAMRRHARWGVPTGALNNAMLRADKVGSVLKLMAMFAMADAAALDGAPQPTTAPNCSRSFGALFTDARGRVRPAGELNDHQTGPIPVGASGLNDGLDAAVGASCNTYFGLAATMALGDPVVETVRVDRCPFDRSLQRHDDLGSQRWIICRAPADAQRMLAPDAEGQVEWLLLPPGEDLARRGIGPFTPGAPHVRGYFGRAVDAGFWFGFRSPNARGSLWQGASADGYEGVLYRGDWVPGIPRAEGRIFNYPMMLSPRSYFGGGKEHDGQGLAREVLGAARWREFAAQAIGEAGQGSALSVAAMYAALGRTDGGLPAPRLLADAGPPSLRTAFDVGDGRVERLRKALRSPLSRGGTAAAIGTAVKGMDVIGKTGTFELQHRSGVSQEQLRVALEVSCGIPELLPQGILTNRTPEWRSMVGSHRCEDEELTITAVHRYTEGAPPAEPLNERQPRLISDYNTSFAAVAFPAAGTPAPAVVLAVIADIPTVRAAELAKPLLEDIADWMQQGPRNRQ